MQTSVIIYVHVGYVTLAKLTVNSTHKPAVHLYTIGTPNDDRANLSRVTMISKVIDCLQV